MRRASARGDDRVFEQCGEGEFGGPEQRRVVAEVRGDQFFVRAYTTQQKAVGWNIGQTAVAINNALNAALLAGRILGVADGRVRTLVEEYAERARVEVMEKGDRLGQVGWEEYLASMGK